MRPLFVFLLLSSSFAFAGEPIKVCIAQTSGPEAKNWKLQAPVAHRLEQQTSNKELKISAPLLNSDSEKKAKSEAAEKSCNYVLLTSIDVAKDEMFAVLNPSPYAKPQPDANRSLNATPPGFVIKYKLIQPDGKKVAESKVKAPLQQNPTSADFQETGTKLVDALATEVITALAPTK